MKRIIFFSKNLKIGGMEKSLVILLNHLVKSYDVTLVLEEKTGALLATLDSKICVQEYKLSYFRITLIRKIINFSKRLFWSIKNLNKYDFSCNYATYSLIGSRLAYVCSKNSIYYVHSDYYNAFNKDSTLIKNFFKKHNLKKFRKLIFVSNESMNNFKKVYSNYSDKCLVINNLIDYENIIKLSNENFSCINKKNNNFIFMGRLDNDSKNFDLLLSSFKISLTKNKDIKLYIIGDGPYKNNISTFIKKNRLNNNIILISETANPYTYLKACDALVLTSNYEGFPVVYFEALALNKNILTTIVTSDESVNMKDYVTILNRNKKDISDKILKYKKNKNNWNINFKKLNEYKISLIKNIIEEERNE